MALPRSRRSLVIVGAVVLGVLIVVRVGLVVARSAPATDVSISAQTIEVPTPVLAAHGLVQPVARASVATLGGGTVTDLLVELGQVVDKGQVVARISGPTQTETVVAPWRGTVSSLPAHAGDSLPPGGMLLTIADPTRIQIETIDVDEYLVNRVRVGQPATLTFDAVPGRTYRGTVGSVSPQVQTIQGGGVHYPTVIDLPAAAPDLRPGMTVHVLFEP